MRSAQFVCLLLMGVQLGVSYSHALQAPGKRSLPLDAFLLVQTDLLNYQPRLGPVEIGTFVSVLFVVVLAWRRPWAFLAAVVGLCCIVAMWGVWAVFIEPINVQIDGQTVASIPANWEALRDRWHAFHLVRLALAAVGMSALTLSAFAGTEGAGRGSVSGV